MSRLAQDVQLAYATEERAEIPSNFCPVDGVTVAARIWVAVEMELGVKQLAELFPPARPALFALLRETWRAQRQAEEHRG